MTRDPLGDAAPVFDRGKDTLDRYYRMVEGTRMGRGRGQQAYSDKITPANLGKVWSYDKEDIRREYEDYVSAIKDYEFEKNPNAKTEKWKALKMREADLSMLINKSFDDQSAFTKVSDAMQRDGGFRYDEKDVLSALDWANKGVRGRGALDIQPGSTLSATKKIQQGLSAVKPSKNKYVKPDGTYVDVSEVDVNDLRAKARVEIEGLPAKERNALDEDALRLNPNYFNLSADEKMNKLIEAQVLKAKEYLPKNTIISDRATRRAEGAKGSSYLSDKASVKTTFMTDDDIEQNIVSSGKTIKDIPVMALEVQVKDASGEIKENIIEARPLRILRKGGEKKLIVERKDKKGVTLQEEIVLTPYNEAQIADNIGIDIEGAFRETRESAFQEYKQRSKGTVKKKPKPYGKKDAK